MLGILVLLVGSQFVPVNRSNPAIETEVLPPATVRAILRRACYDYHSNETAWPWYSRIAPVSWLVAHDVRKGREEVNFSAWNRMPTQKQERKRKETSKEIEEEEMPPWYYLGVHRTAALSAEDKSTLRRWALGPTSTRK
jgi:hypothetical protein